MKTWQKYLINAAVIAVLFVVISLLTTGGIFKVAVLSKGVLNTYQSNLLIPMGFNIILAVSLNLAAGFLGQLPLGHAGFMSIGGYTAALLTLSGALPQGIGFPAAIIAGGLVAALFGVLIGLPVLRLNGDYLAIITLGFGEIIRVIILNLKFTGGALGLTGIPKLTTVPTIFVWVLITIFVIHVIIKSRHGRAMLSIREDEIAAAASGIPVTYYKVMAFSVSAFFAGVAGGLYAHYISVLNPGNFGFMRSVEILVMVVLGGMGSLVGSAVSASVLTLLPELLRAFSDYRMVAYSLLLVIVMIFKPSGLFGRYDFSLSRLLGGRGDTPSQRTKKGGTRP